jgi:hypothetical protein
LCILLVLLYAASQSSGALEVLGASELAWDVVMLILTNTPGVVALFMVSWGRLGLLWSGCRDRVGATVAVRHSELWCGACSP